MKENITTDKGSSAFVKEKNAVVTISGYSVDVQTSIGRNICFVEAKVPVTENKIKKRSASKMIEKMNTLHDGLYKYSLSADLLTVVSSLWIDCRPTAKNMDLLINEVSLHLITLKILLEGGS